MLRVGHGSFSKVASVIQQYPLVAVERFVTEVLRAIQAYKLSDIDVATGQENVRRSSHPVCSLSSANLRLLGQRSGP